MIKRSRPKRNLLILPSYTVGMTDSEATLLRRELADAFTKIEGLEDTVKILTEENNRLKTALAFYESPNMSTSKPSLYNKARKKFRAKRGEDPSGSPGDKTVSSGEESTASEKKKRGPPPGHVGASHHNKATTESIHYTDCGKVCQHCGSTDFELMRPKCKLVYDMDTSFCVQVAMAVISQAQCTVCSRVDVAPNPFIEGTSFGPVLLGIVMNLFEMSAVDDDIAGFIHATFGFEVTGNTIWNARKAVAAHLMEFTLVLIMRMIQLQSWIQMDETVFKRGDGHDGYVWVVNTPVAVYVWFAPTRAASVLAVHFKWLHQKPVVCDGYVGYPVLSDTIQRCWRHMLAKAEELAVKKGGADEVRYDTLLSFYKSIKEIRTLTPFTVMDLSRTAYAIAMSYEDHKVRTYLLNSIPNMFTFLSHPGMPPHNNDAEREIRDGIIPQRNARHKLTTAKGRRVFSITTTFSRTCHKQGLSTGRALLECILDRDWNLFEKAPDTPYSLTNPDGSRYSIFAGLDPPPLPPTENARQDQMVDVSPVTAA